MMSAVGGASRTEGGPPGLLRNSILEVLVKWEMLWRRHLSFSFWSVRENKFLCPHGKWNSLQPDASKRFRLRSNITVLP